MTWIQMFSVFNVQTRICIKQVGRNTHSEADVGGIKVQTVMLDYMFTSFPVMAILNSVRISMVDSATNKEYHCIQR